MQKCPPNRMLLNPANFSEPPYAGLDKFSCSFKFLFLIYFTVIAITSNAYNRGNDSITISKRGLKSYILKGLTKSCYIKSKVFLSHHNRDMKNRLLFDIWMSLWLANLLLPSQAVLYLFYEWLKSCSSFNSSLGSFKNKNY